MAGECYFRWLENAKYDIILLKETHTFTELEHIWKQDWSGPVFFSHGTNNSKGCCVLIRDNLDFKSINTYADKDGRFLIVRSIIEGDPITIINIYAPNIVAENVNFIDNLSENISNYGISNLDEIVNGGDWNVIRDPELDKSGGNYHLKRKYFRIFRKPSTTRRSSRQYHLTCCHGI